MVAHGTIATGTRRSVGDDCGGAAVWRTVSRDRRNDDLHRDSRPGQSKRRHHSNEGTTTGMSRRSRAPAARSSCGARMAAMQ